LITPDLIVDLAIETLDTRHREILAGLERDRGLPARTVEPFVTIDYLAGPGFRTRVDTPPAALFGVTGNVEEPERARDGITFHWALACEVTVMGQDRRDTMRRVYWMGLLVAQCLQLNLRRAADPIDAVEVLDVDYSGGTADSQELVAQATIQFAVTVRQTLVTTRPPGGVPTDPYAPPAEWPRVQTVITNVEKEPLP
jgi:hypothetical protein